MNLIPWRERRHDGGGQLAPVTGFRTEMDRLFDAFFADTLPPWNVRGWPSHQLQPPIDIEETDKQVLVRAEIPGVKPDDFELAIDDNRLVISGEKKEMQERKEGGYVYQERRYGSFRREVALPSAVDADNVQAEYADGVLHVTLQKSQQALPKKIKVTAK